MLTTFQNLKLKPGEPLSALREEAAKRMNVSPSALVHFRILKQSLDARKKQDIHFCFSVEADTLPHAPPVFDYPRKESDFRPVVVGFGPAGIFCALALSKAGLRPVVLERGACVEERTAAVQTFWKEGRLDPDTNVQFGEGGAGTFSDGKLTTQINSPLCREVLHEFVQAGAPEEILWLAKPHLGTDKLSGIVRALREKILSLGGEVLFRTPLTDFRFEGGRLSGVYAGDRLIPTDRAVLACGHSARDLYGLLAERGLPLVGKAFSVGLRVEHPQKLIDRAQYGPMAGHPALPPADYKLVHHGRRSVYTFCMCPGGRVVASSSAPGEVVTNGMSRYDRAEENANSALLVGVDAKDFGPSPLDGVRFQQRLERAAFEAGGGNYCAPAQRLGDFLKGGLSSGFSAVRPTYRPGVVPFRLDKLFPEEIALSLKEGIPALDRKLHGFALPDAVLTGVETRSSAPVRLLRGEDLQCPGFSGLYPCGEGCGYAGGIMSAAADGLRVARQILQEL